MSTKDATVLAPDDRSVLLDLLRPPPNMALDVAVATTFTLDLEAALVAPLAFAAFDAAGPGDPIATLEAVRSVADRLAIFCQAGAVSIPSSASDLFAFVEPVVHQVRRPRPGFLFHPKLWALRFAGDDDVALRLIVPTRNITNDASWDAVLRLDGTVAGGPRSSNRPVADLIRWCTSNTIDPIDPDRAAAIESLIESIRRADWAAPEGVNDIAFHAIGVGSRSRPDYSGRRHVVLSPFVNAGGLDIVAPSDDVVLVSRVDQLELLPTEALAGIRCHSIASLGADADAGVNDPARSAEAPPPELLGDLHAKVVVTERAKRAHLFVGSANATDAAYNGNVEIVVELIAGPKWLGIDALLADLAPVLEPCSITGEGQPSANDELQRAVDNLLRDAAMNRVELRVSSTTTNALHVIDVASARPLLPTGIDAEATVELLTRPGYASAVAPGAALAAIFEDVPTADVTPFIVLRLTIRDGELVAHGGTVLRGELIGDPPGRLDAVIARQVDTPAKFLRFLFLLLSLAGGVLPPWLQAALARDPESATKSEQRLLDAGVFEALTRALATNSSALDDLARLVDRLRATPEGQATLPAGFDDLWTAVDDARQKVRARR